MFDYPDVKGQPLESVPTHLNFWLVDSTLPCPAKRRTPLLEGLPSMSKGSQPTDGKGEYDEVIADGVAKQYLRPFRQSKEMLYDLDRWCLWLVGAPPRDLIESPVLQERLKAVTEERRKSPTESVRKAASTPSLFTQIRQPAARYLAVPEVSSENRDYVPMRFYEPNVIAGNKLIIVPDCPLWLFGYLQSAAFGSWVRAFAGRLESRPSISPDLTYCVFPFLAPGSKRSRIEAAAQGVLDAREQYPAETLASLYAPLTMPPALRKAHEQLDRVIDSMYGLKNPTESARIATLLEHHRRMATPVQVPETM